jgi:hypothetical protein
VVHVRRPSGRSLELSVHVRATAEPSATRALGFLFNPTNRTLALAKLHAPLRYAGLCTGERVRLSWGGSRRTDQGARPWPVPAAGVCVLGVGARLPLGWLQMAPRSFLWFAVHAAAPAEHAASEVAAAARN